MRKNRARNRGAALLITLAFIVLISILIVGFAASMRTDRPAANMYLEKTKASLYAQAGVDNVIASLRQATADTNRYWISQPGQLVVGSPTNNNPVTTIDPRKVLQMIVPLHSGAAPSPTPTDPTLQPCNINVTTLRDPTTSLITDRADVSNPLVHALMQVAWIYVRKDGSRDTSQTPSVNAANPVVGRYAYWADDESSKVDYNLAWGRTTTPPNTNMPGNPTKVSLAALTGMTAAMADSIHGYITDTSAGVNFQKLNTNTGGFFNSPEEARQVELSQPGTAAILATNKFELTHYNNDPDTTFFNQPRIVLTTQTNRAGGKPFLNIAVNNVANISDLSSAGPTIINQYNATLQMLVQYLQRSDWPVAPNSSFQQKYYGSYPTSRQLRLMQLAINIIDYVRSKESPDKVIIPSRGYLSGTNFVLSQDTSTNALGNPTNQVFVGMARGPRINEMAMSWEQVAPSKYAPKMKVELYLPRNYGLSSIDLKNEWYGMYFAYQPSVKLGAVTDPTQIVDNAYRFDATGNSTNFISLTKTVLNAGDYATAIWTTLGTNTTGPGTYPPPGRVMGLRAALFHYPNAVTTSTYGKVDFAPLLGTYSNTAYYVDDPAGTTEANISSIEVDDPRINTLEARMAWAGIGSKIRRILLTHLIRVIRWASSPAQLRLSPRLRIRRWIPIPAGTSATPASTCRRLPGRCSPTRTAA